MIITIRPETAADVAVIGSVTLAAFQSTPYTCGAEHLVVDALRQAGALAVSLVAEAEDGTVVGHACFSPATLSDGALGWYGVGPISVLPALQGQGIGSRLMREGLARLKDLGANGCVLVGNPAFYTHFGFRAEADLVLPNVPPEYFMALVLKGDLPKGTVAFHPAFDVRA